MTDKTIKVRVPGTTANCGPGFDSLGIACTIYNELELTLCTADSLSIEVYGEGAANIPCDARNIVWKSARLLLSKAGIRCRGARLKMYNNIPLSRGLGSSAAAIVAGLAAANAAIGGVFDKQAILEMATEIEGHPDNVAPAIFGGVTTSLMHDAKPETLSFLPGKMLKMVVAVPEFNLATKLARQALPLTVPFKDAVFNVSRAALLVSSLCTGDYSRLQYALSDCLHQPYRSSLVPGMDDVFAAANANGAFGATLSGAGPCLIAFADNNLAQIGQSMVDAFAKNSIVSKYIILDIDSQGVTIL